MADHFDNLHDEFHKMAEALGRTNDAVTEAHAGVRDAVACILRAVDAGREARIEREDLRETVHRLEDLVMQLAADVRELRRQRNGDNGGA
jgi:hypothetical protein